MSRRNAKKRSNDNFKGSYSIRAPKVGFTHRTFTTILQTIEENGNGMKSAQRDHVITNSKRMHD